MVSESNGQAGPLNFWHSLAEGETGEFLLDRFPSASALRRGKFLSEGEESLLFPLSRIDTGLDQLDQDLVGAQPPVAGDLAHLFRNGGWQCHALTCRCFGNTTGFGGHDNSLQQNAS
jgi:hypothetical protein